MPEVQTVVRRQLGGSWRCSLCCGGAADAADPDQHAIPYLGAEEVAAGVQVGLLSALNVIEANCTVHLETVVLLLLRGGAACCCPVAAQLLGNNEIRGSPMGITTPITNRHDLRVICSLRRHSKWHSKFLQNSPKRPRED